MAIMTTTKINTARVPAQKSFTRPAQRSFYPDWTTKEAFDSYLAQAIKESKNTPHYTSKQILTDLAEEYASTL